MLQLQTVTKDVFKIINNKYFRFYCEKSNHDINFVEKFNHTKIFNKSMSIN